MSALPRKADMDQPISDVRFVPKADTGASIGSARRHGQVLPAEW